MELCWFTAYADAHGDTASVAVLAELRTSCSERGVRVTKWLGDGAMLSGVDSASVIACVATVRDRVALNGPLAVRAGITVGRVIMLEGDDYVGGAVNRAAQLCRAAAPKRILADVHAALNAHQKLSPERVRHLRLSPV